ncbi:hypothetical protein [Pseudotamlana agarivorans]|uniref:hypothetical protein n=1 Tax=Pseudotamlana agarivorans TaxID=481183 RepID=UPI00082E517C|nr:hypothetical protein [Tamlana agarivorans]
MKKLIIPVLALLFIACDDAKDAVNEAVKPTETIEAIQEYALVNQIFQDIGNNNGDAILQAEGSSSAKLEGTKNSPEITVTPMDLTTFPKTITVDFQDGTLGRDGITRKGIVTIVSTGWYGEEGTTHTATFDGFYHNAYKVEGTQVVENLGEDEDGNLKYSVTIENGKITDNNGAAILYSEDSYRTWISGADTPLNIWDDEYLLGGTQSGESSNGIAYELAVEESLHFVLLPRAVKAGVLRLDVGVFDNVILDYSAKTITILGITYPLEQ